MAISRYDRGEKLLCGIFAFVGRLVGNNLQSPGRSLTGRNALWEHPVPISFPTAMCFLHSQVALFSFFFFFFLQAQKKPAVLCGFLLETTVFMKNNLSRIRIAACNLAGETRVQVQGGS